MSMPFGQPSSGDWFKPADAYGHLILVTKVHEIGTRFDGLANKDKPHGVFDMVDLDSPTQVLQEHMNDSHPGIVNKLVKALRSNEMVLGRITQAPSQAGNNPAWVLGPFQPGADDQRAMAWVNANPLDNFGQPSGPHTPPPAPAPAPQPRYPQAQPNQYQPAPGMQPQQYAPPATSVPPAPQQYAPAPAAPQPMPQPAQQYPPQQAAAPAPAQAPPPQLDPNNLPPEVAALLAQIQNGGQQQPTG